MKTLIIDNYDSFTYNLYHLVAGISGTEPVVVRNDELLWKDFAAIGADNVILSPGPGRPENPRDFGICGDIILRAEVPVLGICLGLQGMGFFFGGRVVRAPQPVHGRASRIHHDGSSLFRGLPETFEAIRYHSLVLAQPVPDSFRLTAWAAEDSQTIVMGLEHRSRPLFGVQFHPESISTEYGEALVRNFLGPQARTLPVARAVKPVRATGAAERTVLWRKLDANPDPENVFARLFSRRTPSFWLDSSDPDRGRSRFSFMGTAEIALEGSTALDLLEAESRRLRAAAPDLPFDFVGGFVGYFGYELKAQCGGNAAHRSRFPDARLLFVERFLAFDHHERCLYLVAAVPSAEAEAGTRWLDEIEAEVRAGLKPEPLPASNGETVAFRLEQDRAQYLAAIEESRRLIAEGESYEICLTNRLEAKTGVRPFDYYRVLRRGNPAPYSAFLQFEDFSVACSSPERFLKIDRGRVVEARPIKGTLRRSSDPREDQELREALMEGVKTRSENLMIVDLLRNDLGRVCEVGSVHVPQMMEVESYTNLHQLVSTVRGRLSDDRSAIDCLRSAFPGGSMTGAPKIRTMELIDRLEPSARGVYSGAIGFLSLNGTMDLNIVIRTAVFADGEVSIGIGGAIVALSNAEAEFDEILLKGRALIDAFRPLSGRVILPAAGETKPSS